MPAQLINRHCRLRIAPTASGLASRGIGEFIFAAPFGCAIAFPLRSLRATGVEPIRLWILPIRLLRLLGYDTSDKTVAVRHRDIAVKSYLIVRSAIAPTAVASLPVELVNLFFVALI